MTATKERPILFGGPAANRRGAKLSPEVAAEIRAARAAGAMTRELAARHGVTRQAVWLITSGQSWVTGGDGDVVVAPPRPRRGRPPRPGPRRGEAAPWSVLTEAVVAEVRRLYRTGMSGSAVAAALGLKYVTVQAVLTGRSWRHVPDPLGPVVMRRRGRPRKEGGATS